jgi:hypothetical protein
LPEIESRALALLQAYYAAYLRADDWRDARLWRARAQELAWIVAGGPPF